MSKWIFQRCGPHYILAMMVLTRLIGSVGGVLTIYYLRITLSFPEPIQRQFELLAAVTVVLAVGSTIALALGGTCGPGARYPATAPRGPADRRCGSPPPTTCTRRCWCRR
jgi:hypothetical protein